MITALRWAAMGAILMFQYRKWWTKSQDSVHKPQPFWRERRAEAVSNRGPSAYQRNALPLGQTGSLRVSRQLRGNKECLFSGVTKSGRVWRRVPESDARSVPSTYSHVLHSSRIASFHHIAPCLTIRSPHRQTGQADLVVWSACARFRNVAQKVLMV